MKLLTAALTIIMLGVLVFVSKPAKAYQTEDKTKKFIGCTITEEGTVIMVGGRCGTGSHSCIANPCY